MNIQERYNLVCNEPSDIHEHLPTLKQYTEECETVVEMGVRWITSTWAFLAGQPKKLTSIDIQYPKYYNANLEDVESLAEEAGIEFKFVLGDTLNMTIEECDMLFIDTWHVYDQLKAELALHADKVKKYIIMHDTTSFGFRGESINDNITESITAKTVGEGQRQGIVPAINEFLESHKEWKLKSVYENNNGLTIIQRQA
tara:strand:- start:736 stop:1332 length:597 start_codon:yes stop_codon:yes gene_type:complete